MSDLYILAQEAVEILICYCIAFDEALKTEIIEEYADAVKIMEKIAF